MKKLVLGGLAAAAMVAPLALTSPVSAAQPNPTTTTTATVTVYAASEAVIDLPALNSQFTTMQLTADGTAHWGTDALRFTAYSGGDLKTGEVRTTGLWGPGDDATVPGHGPLLLEATQVGAVIYRIDSGAWQELNGPTPINPTGNGTHHVQVAYNDRPGSYTDNSGSLSLKVLRVKA